VTNDDPDDYRAYLLDIADRDDSTPDEFVRHLHKHLRELEDRPVTEEWLASLENLVALLEIATGIEPQVSVKLARLYAHEEKNAVKTVRHHRGGTARVRITLPKAEPVSPEGFCEMCRASAYRLRAISRAPWRCRLCQAQRLLGRIV
jgi:hypothetical protein